MQELSTTIHGHGRYGVRELEGALEQMDASHSRAQLQREATNADRNTKNDWCDVQNHPEDVGTNLQRAVYLQGLQKGLRYEGQSCHKKGSAEVR